MGNTGERYGLYMQVSVGLAAGAREGQKQPRTHAARLPAAVVTHAHVE